MKGNKYIIGIDLGGTNIRIALVNQQYKALAFVRLNSKDCISTDATHDLKNIIENYINSVTNIVEKKDICAISLGVPAVVHKNHSYVYSAPNIIGLNNVDLGVKLTEKLSIPVFVDRDVNYILMHDIKKHNLDPDNNKTILGQYLGTGFGNSIYIDGKIHLGAHGAAGELGHIPLYNVSEKCTCGQVGCVETLISGRYLQNIRNKYFSDCDISEIFLKHYDHPIISKFIDDIALPCATEATLLDPDYIILGGGVISMEGFPIERLCKTIKSRTRHPYPAEDLKFIISKESQEAGIIGGAMLASNYIK